MNQVTRPISRLANCHPSSQKSDAVTAANSELLAKNKISHIVNIPPSINFFGPLRIPYRISQKYPNWKPKYLRLYVTDDPKGKIAKFFEVRNNMIVKKNDSFYYGPGEDYTKKEVTKRTAIREMARRPNLVSSDFIWEIPIKDFLTASDEVQRSCLM
ncbi:hypothetical protein C1646_772860 [Rhizophagus diaphanus]|nr:hypothetical protein C1646_772860 [Rhizophagus diaphanus] [Rhizophagus sp. MUCL 43196]